MSGIVLAYLLSLALCCCSERGKQGSKEAGRESRVRGNRCELSQQNTDILSLTIHTMIP